MTDMTLNFYPRDADLRTYMPLAQGVVPYACCKDVLQIAFNGGFAQDTSLEHLFDWLEGRK